MTTYTKETALYDTGKISNDIASAGETASKFLSVDSSGIMVYDGSNGAQAPSTVTTGTKNVFIDDDSMDVRDGTAVLASFGASGTTINGPSNIPIAHLGYGPGSSSGGGTSLAPYYSVGMRNGAIGNYSVSEGYSTTSSGYASHAEGHNTTASGLESHAEGQDVIADGTISHAEGRSTKASGNCSHSEGYITRASGDYSHAEGYYTFSLGLHSHTQNNGTVATESNQTVIGSFNSATRSGSGTPADPYVYSDVGNYSFIIGNGIASDTASRSNALTVDWNGNVEAEGTIISDTEYSNAWNEDSSAGYSVIVSSLAGSTYLGQSINIGTNGSKHPIFNGFDISGTGTARIHTLGHYIYKSGNDWAAYIKMRNDNTSAITNFTVTAYIAWI